MKDLSTTRRTLLAATGLTGLTAALAACAGPGSTGGGEEPAAGGETSAGGTAFDAAQATGEISFAHWRGEDQAVFDEIITQFTAEHPDTSVRQDIQPSNDYQSNAITQIRTGTIGDLFVAFRGAQFVDMVEAGLYADLTDTDLPGMYQTDLVEPGVTDGVVHGFPYQLVFNQPIINEDLFGAAGISGLPTDWDAWMGMLEALAGQDVVPIAWPGGDAGNQGQLFNSMIMNLAPSDDMCTKIETGEYQVTDDWFLEMLAKYQEMIPFFQPNSNGTAVEPAEQMFASGEAAMLATGSFHITACRSLGAEFPIGMVAPITTPAGETPTYEGIRNVTFVLGVSTASDNPDTAYALLEFLSRPEIAAVYGDGTAQHVTVADVEYTNADLQHNVDWLERNTMLAPRFQFNDLDIRAAAENTVGAVVGGASPEQAAEEAQTIIDERIV